MPDRMSMAASPALFLDAARVHFNTSRSSPFQLCVKDEAKQERGYMLRKGCYLRGSLPTYTSLQDIKIWY